MIFLQNYGALGGVDPSAFIAMAAAFMAVALAISVVLWVYMSLAYMAIGRKLKLSSPGLAWIPGVGPLINVYRGSKMHWWPWLLLIGLIIPFVGFIFQLAFAVFAIIWHWKSFEAMDKPGWLSILLIIPVVNLIIIGVVAWSK